MFLQGGGVVLKGGLFLKREVVLEKGGCSQRGSCCFKEGSCCFKGGGEVRREVVLKGGLLSVVSNAL